MNCALLILIVVWRASPAQPLREIQAFDTDRDGLSRIGLLMRERGDDEDGGYSNIPADAFVPDNTPPHSRKRDLSSLYLQGARYEQTRVSRDAGAEAALWGACGRLAESRAAPDAALLLYMCATLLAAAGPAPRAPAPDQPCACPSL